MFTFHNVQCSTAACGRLASGVWGFRPCLAKAKLAEMQDMQEALQHSNEEKEFLQAQLEKADGPV